MKKKSCVGGLEIRLFNRIYLKTLDKDIRHPKMLQKCKICWCLIDMDLDLDMACVDMDIRRHRNGYEFINIKKLGFL